MYLDLLTVVIPVPISVLSTDISVLSTEEVVLCKVTWLIRIMAFNQALASKWYLFLLPFDIHSNVCM